jgi:hypothetical protein
MFEEEDVRSVSSPDLPRLVRVIFHGLQITNDGYLKRYAHHNLENNNTNKTQKEHSQKAAADRKFLLDPRKLTINMMRNVLIAMGYDIEAISIRLRDRMSGEELTFSTDDTIDDLKKRLETSQEIGISGIEI